MTVGNGARLDGMHDRLTEAGMPALGRNVMATNLVILSLDEYDRLIESIELLAAARVAAEPYVTFVEDLDRDQFGVRFGENVSGSDGGWSTGNPFLQTGQVIGFGVDGPGRAYMVPEPGERGKIENWVTDLRGDV